LVLDNKVRSHRRPSRHLHLVQVQVSITMGRRRGCRCKM